MSDASEMMATMLAAGAGLLGCVAVFEGAFEGKRATFAVGLAVLLASPLIYLAAAHYATWVEGLLP